jgi:hypothetical protein
MYVAGRLTFRSRSIGLLASALLAVAPFHVYYSQEARPYSLVVVATLLNLCAFEYFLRRRTLLSWGVYALAIGAGLYSFYFSAIVVGIELLYLLVLALATWPNSLRIAASGLLAAVAGAVSFLPWAIYATWFQVTHSSNWPPLPPFSPARLWQSLTAILAFGAPEAYTPRGNPPLTLALTVLLLITAGFGAVLARGRTNYRSIMLVSVAAVAIPLIWVSDSRARYFFLERQAIFILPIILLLTSAGAVELATRLRSPGASRALDPWMVQGLLVGAILALSAGPLRTVYEHPWFPKEDWRAATAFVSGQARTGDRIYSTVPDPYDGLTYYNRDLETVVEPLAVGPFYPDGAAEVAASHVRRGDWIVTLPISTRSDTESSRLENILAALGMRRYKFHGLEVLHG